mgnify:CR=1 FL=1
MKKFGIAFLCLTVTIGCKGREAGDDRPLRVGLNIWPGYGAFLIADAKKLFAEEGVDVDIQIIQDDPAREAALLSGKLDGIGMTMDNLVLLNARGVKCTAIYKYDGSAGADGIIAGAGVNAISDLKEKRVAWASGTTSHFFLVQALKDVGLSTSDLKHVDMSSDEAGAAFASGAVEAAVTWEPWLSKAKEVEGGKVLLTTKELPVIEDVLFMENSVLAERPDEVTRFLRACFRAVDYWKEHPDEGNKIIADRFDLPLKDVEGMLSGIEIMDLQKNKAFFGIGQEGASPAVLAYKSARSAWEQEGLIGAAAEPVVPAIDSSFVQRAASK